jgi:hypothetical protein
LRRSNPVFIQALDCFTEPVIGPAKPDPLARNDDGLFHVKQPDGSNE